MSGGIGEGRTRVDHRAVARLLYAGCASVERARALEAIVGRSELTLDEQQYLTFGERFEREFLHQRSGDRRAIVDTLDLGWRVASLLPASDLADLPPDLRARCTP